METRSVSRKPDRADTFSSIPRHYDAGFVVWVARQSDSGYPAESTGKQQQ
jgi:hypothetical protein